MFWFQEPLFLTHSAAYDTVIVSVKSRYKRSISHTNYMSNITLTETKQSKTTLLAYLCNIPYTYYKLHPHIQVSIALFTEYTHLMDRYSALLQLSYTFKDCFSGSDAAL